MHWVYYIILWQFVAYFWKPWQPWFMDVLWMFMVIPMGIQQKIAIC